VRFIVWVVALVLALVACDRSSEPEAIPNVKLGMSPRDVRDRFDTTGTGSWQTSVGTGDDTALEWTAKDAGAKLAHARFEFHLGMLVAIRARSTDRGTNEHIATTPKTVTVHRPDPEGGTSVVILARDCPTHKDEAEGFAARANPKK